MVTKLLSMLGLARRAGKLESGFDAAVIAAREGKAGVHALTDRGFAKAVLSMVEDGKREKEECVL